MTPIDRDRPANLALSTVKLSLKHDRERRDEPNPKKIAEASIAIVLERTHDHSDD